MSAAKHVSINRLDVSLRLENRVLGPCFPCNSTPLERVIVSTGSAAKLIIIGPADGHYSRLLAVLSALCRLTVHGNYASI